MNFRLKPFFNLNATLCGILMLAALPMEDGQAEQLASPWVIDQYTKSRLFIGGYDKERKILHVGWQLSLKEGWKTYWRSPGDAGLPPRWDWKARNNISSITVNWPLPEKLRIFDMDTYIYHDEVVLPVEIAVSDDKKPLSLALDLEFMICEEICVPLEGRYGLNVSALENIKVSLYQQALLNRYSQNVPRKISGENVVITNIPQEKTIMIELPEEYKAVNDLIVEGPEDIMFAKPVEITGQDRKIFQLKYEAENTALLAGAEFTLTLLAKEGPASELTVALPTFDEQQ